MTCLDLSPWWMPPAWAIAAAGWGCAVSVALYGLKLLVKLVGSL